MVLRMPSGVFARYPFSGALGLGTFWAGPLASALRYSPLPALLPALLLEPLLVAGLPEAVDPSPAVVMSCGTQAASRVLRLMSVPPVSIERRFSMLGFMVGPPHRCSAWSPAYLNYARARTGSLTLISQVLSYFFLDIKTLKISIIFYHISDINIWRTPNLQQFRGTPYIVAILSCQNCINLLSKIRTLIYFISLDSGIMNGFNCLINNIF